MNASNANQGRMDTWQTILGWAAMAVVYGAYVPWIAKRLNHTRGRRPVKPEDR
jgi:hypothetical protein